MSRRAWRCISSWWRSRSRRRARPPPVLAASDLKGGDGGGRGAGNGRLHRLRWRIEEVFRALTRDGPGLDATQVWVPDKRFRLAAPALGEAVRLLQLVSARAGGQRPISDMLDEASLPRLAALGRARAGTTARLRNPHPSGSLAWLSWIVARQGGWNSAGKPPGAKIIASGWQTFAAMLAGALLSATEVLPYTP